MRQCDSANQEKTRQQILLCQF